MGSNRQEEGGAIWKYTGKIKHFQSKNDITEVYSLKPIFHQNAKYLASGTFASPNAKDSTFASPNARNTNMLGSLALGDASFWCWPCTFHFFGVYFFALGSKRKPHFQWNIGCVGCLALGLCVR